MTEARIDQVRQLSDWLAATDIALLELTGPDRAIRLRRNGGGSFVEEAVPAAAPDATVVRAGSVGLYLDAHPLRAEPLVRPGDAVAAGQALALLKIGLVLLAVPAPRAGVVARIVATPGRAVGYGDPLVELE
ncbi:MAG: acetyl-CoA carboxylase biotin carboxyl carrier protein subunit [Rubrivivax sp.]